jgi:hypothetical protein
MHHKITPVLNEHQVATQWVDGMFWTVWRHTEGKRNFAPPK